MNPMDGPAVVVVVVAVDGTEDQSLLKSKTKPKSWLIAHMHHNFPHISVQILCPTMFGCIF